MDNEQLAIAGGQAVRCEPFAPWPYFAEDEIDAVTQVLRSGRVNYWTGDACKRFEQAYADYTQTRYAIALANGTLALELALYALDIGVGDEVIVPSRTFIASASCVVARGATPVIVDVDATTQNLTVETIRVAITPRTKAIIAVHLAGWPCDMDAIMAFAREHGLKVIEDCAQAHGATYKGKPVGSLGDMAAFSFCQDKIITTGGEGGMLVLNDELLWKKAWAYKDHGKSWDAVHLREHPPGFRWLHESFGTNWRMTEMQAAIGLQQLAKLNDRLQIRLSFAHYLTTEFGKHKALRLTVPDEDIGHAYYKYYAFLRIDMLKPDWDQARVVAAINAEGVPCYTGSSSEIYRELAFVNAGMELAQPLSVAQKLGDTSIMFLVHPTLSLVDMRDTSLAVAKVLAQATC
ncbi:MAG: DegT/DnrJ/EryC1/StrS aminotransferase family protein [Sulfuriferula sp.]|nr:DegT/DnrJ/EryC1/StrS aminotransferase family protein [Sulfuriferula sp.]